jgi:hypothetical protein
MPEQKIILHFGMDKTGSTSIRASLARHLDDPRFHYVTPGGMENASRCLAAAFKNDPLEFHFFRNSGFGPADRPRLRRKALAELMTELERAGNRTAVISAEAVSRFNAEELQRMHEFLARVSSEVVGFAYIRRPKEYMESSLQQQIKGFGTRVLNVDSLAPDYRTRFEPFDQVFAPGTLHLHLFEPRQFTGGDVVLDFCARLGIRFDPARAIRTNEGISRAALGMLFAYRKFAPQPAPGPNTHRDNEALVRRLRKLGGPKLRLHSEVVLPALEQQRESIAWMEQRLGCSMQEDVAAHDADAVRTEERFLEFDQAALDWLGEQFPEQHPARRAQAPGDAREVGRWLNDLRGRLAARADREAA